jgi:hypothetical protein
MEIVRIQGIEDQWDRFVWASPGGTIFSTLRFLNYHPPLRFDFLNLAAREGSDLVSVIAGGDVERTEGRFFRAPLGASFGGFVFKDGCGLRQMLDVVEAITARIESLGYAGIELVLPPPCYSTSDQSLPFVLGKVGYHLAKRDATFAVPLDAVEKEDLDPVLLRNLRKAEKGGINVHAATGLEGFYDVLVTNLAEKGAKPTHTREELASLFSLFPDRLILLEATLGSAVVGGCLLILCNSRVGLAFYICDDRAYSQLRVAEAALVSAASLLKRMGYKYFDLGTVSTGSDVNWGLVRFKSKFRPATYVREHYILKFRGPPD